MTTILGVTKYYERRRRWTVLICILATIAISLIAMFSELHNAQRVMVSISPSGVLETTTTYHGYVSVLSDPSNLSYVGTLMFLVVVLTVMSLHRDRRFLVSLSVTRYQQLLGMYLYLICMAIGLILLGGVLLPILTRALLLVLGYPLKGGWDTLLTGGNANMARDLFVNFCQMISSIGWFALIGYVVNRWWKVLLILMGAGIVLLIAFLNLINISSFVMNFADSLLDWARWAVDTVIPWLEEFFKEENILPQALTAMASGVVCMIISYPVMRGMRVT
ncbi:hypothetical protein LJC33_06940 [Eubacteriales bacterium OttesenSCG-928-N13]|nr:hypothetical protein [Eubacteriales bacterium OttesenSCG-928-N13]